jgi:hypothetical protein
MIYRNIKLAVISMTNKMAYVKELSCVLIAVINADAASENSNVETDAEVRWQHWETGPILLKDHLAFQEDALRGSTVHLLWLTDHN